MRCTTVLLPLLSALLDIVAVPVLAAEGIVTGVPARWPRWRRAHQVSGSAPGCSPRRSPAPIRTIWVRRSPWETTQRC